MKRVMLSVLGLSPQVLTEALYALNQENRMVNEIHVITTRTGKDLIHSRLLASGEGAYFKFLEEYDIPKSLVSFDPSNIHVLKDNSQYELDDIVSPEHNEILIEKCMNLTWELTSNDSQAVYFMIAGGRKTMSACLALAAQFYGRPQDRIFHVLVSPEFENSRDFFYPPKKPRLVATIDKTGARCFRDSKDAKIWLISMPFVSVRDKLRSEDLEKPADPDSLMASLIRDNPPGLEIDLSEGFLTYKLRRLDLKPTELALLTFFAWIRKKCGCNKEECANCFLSINEITTPDNQKKIAQFYSQIRPYTSMDSKHGITKLDGDNFASYRTKLNNAIKKHFGAYGDPLTINSLGPKLEKRYGIFLDPKNITIKR